MSDVPLREHLEHKIDSLREHIDLRFDATDASLEEREMRHEQRFLAQEQALKVAQDREDNYLSKSMGYVLIALTALTAIVGFVAIFYRGVA